ncbi:prenyltransferase/squalene oxidase repeat-containing protein [Streptomyces sp. NPDC018059]|uniref:prenyltransferase/squalene oxidase repeat-containing protein n=1 Tax=Streptomyces sp. NPDC018059 TaxID=3365041 RepID=UPI0037B0BD26
MAEQARRLACEHLLSLQGGDGAWEGEMVWNTMILSQYVIVHRVVDRPLPASTRTEMVRHYTATVTTEGGWGQHPDSGPSLYCTTLAYVALRLLGLEEQDPLCARARSWLRAQPGGVAAIPTWGKLWLAIIGLYDHRAVNPLPPEIFLLPRWTPVHPDRLYCHTRTIYQAMAYLYGARVRHDLGRLGEALNRELYGERPPSPADRTLLGADALFPPSRALWAAFTALAVYERAPLPGLRRRALSRCLRRVRHEQEVTGQAGISPVSTLLNVVVLHAAGAARQEIERALDGVESWRWRDPERGIRYAGARSHSWDTAFAVEALLAGNSTAPQDTGLLTAVRAACSFLTAAQLTENIPDATVTARAPAQGGWCFSEGAHRWPVSDCTAEAAAALLHAARVDPRAPVPDRTRLAQATRFLLHRQNGDGGFGTYEPRRGPRLLERLNPAEMFTNCVVEDSYIECTGSALVALAELPREASASDAQDTARARRRALRFLLRSQSPDGSWPAAWGVNRIYGTLFAVRGLHAAGLPAGHPSMRRAAEWLESAQQEDGGWSEHHRGCLEQRYVQGGPSQPVQTAWAVLALLHIRSPDSASLESGVRWLCARQAADGTWRQETAAGVFFGTAMLDYRLYAAYFPLWALGRWLATTHAASGRPC